MLKDTHVQRKRQMNPTKENEEKRKRKKSIANHLIASCKMNEKS